MRVEQTGADILGRLQQPRSAVKGDAGDFASVLASVQSEHSDEKEVKGGNPLGLSDEEYKWCFFGWRFDADHVVYFPPRDAPLEEQRAWYEAIKDLSHLERQLFLSRLGLALRDEDGNASYEMFTEKVKKLGYRGVLEEGQKWMKEVAHDSAGVVDEESFAIIKRHLRLYDELLDAFIKAKKDDR